MKNVRFTRPYSRTQNGLRAVRRKRARYNRDKLGAMIQNRNRIKQVACGKIGHVIVGWGVGPDVCELCEKEWHDGHA